MEGSRGFLAIAMCDSLLFVLFSNTTRGPGEYKEDDEAPF